MEASLKMALKMVVMLFALVSTMFGGVQGNEVVQGEKKICMPIIPCVRPSLCCTRPPPAKATNP